MNHTQKILISALVLIGVVLIAWRLEWFSYLTLENIRGFSAAHPVLGPVMFVLMYVTVIVLMLPIIPFAVLAGALFGLWAGFAYVSVGAIIGACAAFYIARHFGSGIVEKISRGKFKKVHEYDRKIAANGLSTVLFIRLMPLLPFKSPNYILGFTKVKARDYVLATAIGVLPESFVFAFVGSSFSSLSPAGIFVALLLVGGLCTVGFLIGRHIQKRNGRDRRVAHERK